MRSQASPRHPFWDRLGLCAGTLCAVHCALSGLAVGLAAFSAFEFLHHPAVEIGFFAVALVVGAVALVHGIRAHHSRIPAVVFIVGLSLIVAAHPLGEGTPLGIAMLVFGGLCIASFHVLNLRLQHRKCGCPLSH